jgi:hypothetical protein
MKNINFLYEFMTPNGVLPLGYEIIDIPIIFNEINDSLIGINNGVMRTVPNPKFHVSNNTSDIFDTLSEYLPIHRKLVSQLNTNDDYNLFVITSTNDETIVEYVSRLNFDYIFTKKSFSLFKKNDNVKLIFIDNKEGCLEYTDNFFKNIHAFVEKYFLKNNKVIFITNTSNIKQIYENYLTKHNLSSFMICETINFYIDGEPGKNIIKYQSTTNNYETDKIIERGTEYSLDCEPSKKERTKYFLCLNRNSGRLHRPKMVLNLIQRGLFDKGLISLFKSTEFDNFCEQSENIDYKLHIKEKYPFVIDYEDAVAVADMHNYFTKKDMWNDTYFSVVNETGVTNGSIFITEKTIRPMIYFHPFIVYGNPHTLAELRKLGFETFPEFFDESYDMIEDEQERLSVIVTNIERLCSLNLHQLHELYHSVYPKLIHNRNLLVKFSVEGVIKNKFLQTISV